MVTADTLAMFAPGTVQVTTYPTFKAVSTGILRQFIPADCNQASSFSSKTVEKVRVLPCCLVIACQ